MIRFENELGDVNIASDVLANMVGIAATSCYGVVGMASRNTVDGLTALLGIDHIERGVRVDIINDKLHIDLHIVVMYGVNLLAIAESIIHKVKYSIEEQSGFEVGEVTVYVDGMKV